MLSVAILLVSMSIKSRILKLPDGRQLGYCVAGVESGKPIFTFHGLPGSRLESYLLDSAAKKHNVTIVTPDRPGYGLSSRQVKRTLLDWSEDVSHLADALGLDTFGVIGVSGGAPCALSCSYSIPQRIDKLGIICGLGPLYETGLTSHMHWFARVGFYLARQLPWLLKLTYGLPVMVLAKTYPALMLDIIALVNGGVDRQVLNKPKVREMLVLNIQEAFKQGTEGAIQDMQLYSQEWGFSLQDIQSHIDIWHGSTDKVVPIAHGQYLHDCLPDSTLNIIVNQAHFSLPITCAETILDEFTNS
jgi:pimeloyl-ACP methyl ester carboxylesterase